MSNSSMNYCILLRLYNFHCFCFIICFSFLPVFPFSPLQQKANFILSFIAKHFTDYSLIYMFLNILVGVVPWIALLIFYHNKPPLTWSICLVINVLAFFGLIVFKGRTMLAEFKKRFHL